MDSRALVEPDIKIGGRVAEVLATDPKLGLRSALWWFDEHREQWLFVLSATLNEREGPKATYLQVDRILKHADLTDKLPLDRVAIIEDAHPVLTVLRNLGVWAANARLIGIVVDGMILPDMHIYLLKKRRAGTRKKKTVNGH